MTDEFFANTDRTAHYSVNGTDMIIANGADVEQLYALLDGRAIGTRFTGKKADA